MFEQIKLYCFLGYALVLFLFIKMVCVVIKMYRMDRDEKLEEMRHQRPINSIGWGKCVRGPEYKKTSKESVFATIKRIIQEKTDVLEEDIQENASLADIGIDSIDRINILVAIEDKFMINISESEFLDIKKINDLVQICTKNKKLDKTAAEIDQQR